MPLDLTIDLATTTMAACSDPSLDRVFLDFLDRVASYSTANGELSLDITDGGVLQFKTSGA